MFFKLLSIFNCQIYHQKMLFQNGAFNKSRCLDLHWLLFFKLLDNTNMARRNLLLHYFHFFFYLFFIEKKSSRAFCLFVLEKYGIGMNIEHSFFNSEFPCITNFIYQMFWTCLYSDETISSVSWHVLGLNCKRKSVLTYIFIYLMAV